MNKKTTLSKKARVIAFYLPQYHPIPENDRIWGKGFTEWTNVANAKPLFKGHYQPQLPADLGFYDLRLPQVRQEQAEMAKQYGIEGFCYWHYWFGNGRRILEMPFNEVLKSGEPDFPFCLGWANHSWSTKTWQKSNEINKDITFLEQTYPGDEDYIQHFMTLLPAFKDHRYITVDGKPLFLVYSPQDIPDNKRFIDIWNKLAVENGLKGIYFICRLNSVGKFKFQSKDSMLNSTEELYDSFRDFGYDAISSTNMRYAEICSRGYFHKILRTILSRTVGNVSYEKYDYPSMIKYLYTKYDYRDDVYPQLVPRWDKTPRKGKDAEIYDKATPEYFAKSIDYALDCIAERDFEHRILFLFAWNEWGEGAYMEPDLKYGKGHLEALKSKIITG